MNHRQFGGVLMILGLAAVIPVAPCLGTVPALFLACFCVVVGAVLAFRD